MLIDTHCHLDNPHLYGRIGEILSNADNCGVTGFLIPGLEPSAWDRLLSLSRNDPRIVAAPGIHPQYAHESNPRLLTILANLARECPAIGEIGLDYSPGMPSREIQQAAFRAQLEIAANASLPVIIHCRKAFADLLHILKATGRHEPGGVMHAYSGSVEFARECISLGMSIGIAGPVTWEGAVKPVTIAREIPLASILLETDSPDMPPVPHRGEMNQPAFLLHIARKVAEIKEISLNAVTSATSENARNIFHRNRGFYV